MSLYVKENKKKTCTKFPIYIKMFSNTVMDKINLLTESNRYITFFWTKIDIH